jgi:hypothetical protein
VHSPAKDGERPAAFGLLDAAHGAEARRFVPRAAHVLPRRRLKGEAIGLEVDCGIEIVWQASGEKRIRGCARSQIPRIGWAKAGGQL